MLRRSTCLAGFALAVASAGCGLFGLFQDECGPTGGAAAQARTPDETLSSIQQALRYLRETQLSADQRVTHQVDYAGDWPQCAARHRGGPWLRDASPFMATFVHHALALVSEAHRDALVLTDEDVAAARAMRIAAVDLMNRFRHDVSAIDAGTYGFWPPQQDVWLAGDTLLAAVFVWRAQGPQLWGTRAPVNVSFIPPGFAVASDADDTATIHAVLLDHHRLDGGAAVTTRFERCFVDWRDLGHVPQRNTAPWVPKPSGAFLTWLAYDDDAQSAQPNDVDPVVNANVLYALGRYGRLETPGVAEAVDLIIAATRSGTLSDDPDGLSLYYPDNLCFHYCVARAYREGGVAALETAVEMLVADLVTTMQTTASGAVFWDRGDPHLSTAFGALALLQADRRRDIASRAIDYLLAEQDPVDGSWEAGVFFRGRFDGGPEAIWMSAALTTAMAMEAVASHHLAAAAPVVNE